MADILRRYFVDNSAPILCIRRHNTQVMPYTLCRTGNSGGFYWGRWQVTWRQPYSKEWAFSEATKSWVPAYWLKEQEHEG